MSELKERRELWYHIYKRHLERLTERFEKDGISFTCPCCGYPTLIIERGNYEICFLCDWEDDGQDDSTVEEVWGGPNKDYSLAEARENFKNHLTMWRPNDTERFQRDTKNHSVKLEIIALFNRMIKGNYFDASEIKLLKFKLLEDL